MPLKPGLYGLAQNQTKARQQARSMQDNQNHSAITIESQDNVREAEYVIYIYNILDRQHYLQQPPLFPGFMIPACPKGKRYVYTLVPAFVKEPYFKPGTTEFYYKNVDGRKAAMSLLNPNAFPGTKWDSQVQNWDSEETAISGSGNNLNLYGCWWSLTRPDEVEQLDEEIKVFRDITNKTMNRIVKEAETFSAAGDLKSISPLAHFAMDYLGKQAPWHMAAYHMISCPNCGDPVKEGIAYHRNSFGERCIVDVDRYKKMLADQKAIEADAVQEPEGEEAPAPAPRKKKASRAA